MRMSEILKSSFDTLRMNGRRTFLTMIGIIIGIAAVITIMSLGNGFRQQTIDNLTKDEKGRMSQRFSFNPENQNIDWAQITPFSKDNLSAIEEMPGVDEVKLDSETSVQTQYSQIKVREENLDFEFEILPKSDYPLIAGRNLTQADSDYRSPYMMLNEDVATQLYGSAEKAVGRSATLDGHEFTIVGIFIKTLSEEEQKQQEAGYYFSTISGVMPRGTFDRYYYAQNFDFGIQVYFEDGADMSTINKKIKSYLDEAGAEISNGSYTYFDSSEMMAEVGKTLSMVTLFISAVAGISLFIAGVGVMNMMYISVSERTKEIGIRRSLGATKDSIQWQFLLEGIAITTFGGIIGYLSGIGIALLVSRFIPFNALFDVTTALVSVLISVLIGIVFSVFPARAASRKNVVEILR